MNSRAARKRLKKLVAIDLFAGCGGLSLGLEQAGFHVATAVEINPKRATTYALNHPKTVVLQQDIRGLSASDLLSAGSIKPGGVALLAGCPPCQGFSRIRRRNSHDAVPDARNDLPSEFARLILELRPSAIMMENVPGLERDLSFEILLRRLRGAGYRLSWQIIDLAMFGVPQRRKRLVLIGWLGTGQPDLAQLRAERPRTVRNALAHLPHIPARCMALHKYVVPRSELVEKRIRGIPRDGGGRADLPRSLSLECHRREHALGTRNAGFRDVYGRMSWDAPAPTITGGCINPSKGRFLHPVHDRAITLLEAARLQTFPIGYRFDIRHGRYPIAEMIGEALPPRSARRIGGYLRERLSDLGYA